VVVAVATLIALASAPAAGAASYGPPPGRVYAGVTGGLSRSDYTSFTALVGKHVPVWQLFLTWSNGVGAMQYLQVRLQDAASLRVRLMLSLSTANSSGHEVLSPAALAGGAGDGYLLGLNRVIAASHQYVYVRVYPEMNNAANVYSSVHGAGHSTASFRNAYRRTVLILRGGALAAINARLRSLGMPALHAQGNLPVASVSSVWCPHVTSTAGSIGAYYPGGAYVDWTCADIYNGGAPFGALSSIYSQFRKPFAIGEFGFDTFSDDPGFVSQIFAWVRSHPRARMVLYNQGNRPGGRFRLQRYRRSAAALRAALRAARYPEVP
jgi:hypothetical protein